MRYFTSTSRISLNVQHSIRSYNLYPPILFGFETKEAMLPLLESLHIISTKAGTVIYIFNTINTKKSINKRINFNFVAQHFEKQA